VSRVENGKGQMCFVRKTVENQQTYLLPVNVNRLPVKLTLVHAF
jgi:hypothetical protein